MYLMLDFRVAYMLLKPDLVFATNVTNAIEFARINAKNKTKYYKADSACRKPIHPGSLCIPD